MLAKQTITNREQQMNQMKAYEDKGIGLPSFLTRLDCWLATIWAASLFIWAHLSDPIPNLVKGNR
ncbi:MAG: hypothetical protein AAF490_07520 [Chloroflexota bacterium]